MKHNKQHYTINEDILKLTKSVNWSVKKGEPLGIVSTTEALAKSKEEDLDLVVVVANGEPPFMS